MNTLHRSILVIAGGQVACLSRCQSLLKAYKTTYISQLKQNNKPYINYQQVHTQLGQENDTVVFDATEKFEANALGVISGTVVGGGLLVLLVPTKATSDYPNVRFLRRLQRILRQHNIPIYSADNPDIPLPLIKARARRNSTLTLNEEQTKVVKAVTKVVKGHRKRPLVLTADRGRGKSTALGVAAQSLLESGLTKIIICAPAKATVQPLFNQVTKKDGLYYFAPDELDRKHPDADLVIVDEAGAIPIPLLSRLLKHYSRMVFSTTLHGYEGNGKGFAIRFRKKLDTTYPNWHLLHLHTPARWGNNDPLEQLINDILLLDAEPSAPEHIARAKVIHTQYRQLSNELLAKDENTLRQLFGLLVTAHYQTRPSDLVQLLDAAKITIHVLEEDSHLIAATVINHEGGLSQDLSQQIYEGKRRPKGHLTPQILTYQLGITEAATLTTDRIMRIAVHPSLHRKQFGSYLLKLIHQQSSADYLSSCFGMNRDLLHFWTQSGYQMAHLGLKREASSGYHSAVMLCPLTPAGKTLLTESHIAFNRHFLAQLADPLKDYDPDLALALLRCNPSPPQSLLNTQERRDINRFANGSCGYDLVMSSLRQWLPDALAGDHYRIDNTEALLLVMRVLQHHDWAHCCKMLGFQGRQQALKAMQQAVAKR